MRALKAPNTTIFSSTLSKLRKEAGFKTAYQFFHNNGGKPVFKVSYRMYLLIEQGKLRPPFKNLNIYIHALHFGLQSYSAMELVTAWLKTTLGEDDFEYLLGPFIRIPDKPSISPPFHKVINKLLVQKKFYINPEQMRVIVKNKATALCWTALSHDTGIWTDKTLAAELGLSASAAEKALRELGEVKLLKRLKNLAYTCPMAGSMIEYPLMIACPRDTRTSDTHNLHKRFRALRREMISSGKVFYRRQGIIRASSMELANFYPLLSLNVSTAQAYAITKKQKDSALFAVECKVVKIRDF
jgi:hypothetical protein